MLNGLSPSAERFLNALARINERGDRAQRQLSSGLRLERPSDDPDQVNLLLETRAEWSRVTQVSKNLKRIQTEVDGAESALSSAVEALERARVLASQGFNSTQTADTRASIAGEVEGLLSQLVRIANTSVEGRYLFAGNNDQAAPYTLDWTQFNPVSDYQGTLATRQALGPTGDTFEIAHAGDQIFTPGDPGENVMKVVSDLRTALLANDVSGIQTALGNIPSALAHLNSELAFYGSVQSQVAHAADSGASLGTQLEIRVGEIEDADLARAITELEQAQTQQQAALGSWAQRPQRSLFDYLG